MRTPVLKPFNCCRKTELSSFTSAGCISRLLKYVLNKNEGRTEEEEEDNPVEICFEDDLHKREMAKNGGTRLQIWWMPGDFFSYYNFAFTVFYITRDYFVK